MYGPLVPATFTSRPNRFVVECVREGEPTRAFLPNPGRLRESLTPGTELLLERAANPDRRLAWTAVGLRHRGAVIGLDTHRANRLVEELLGSRRLPGLEEFRVVRREVPHGHSRFDFLLEGPGGLLYLEVKSCTQAGRRVGMFPDAASDRGRRHLEELAELADGGTATAVVFLVHSPTADLFLPDFHADLAFARTLLAVRDRVRLLPVALALDEELRVAGPLRPLEIPWEVAERDASDRGTYLVQLHLPGDLRLEVGHLGPREFPAGHAVYVGSAMNGLAARLGRHRRGTGRPHWHLDHLRREARFVEGWPLRSALRLECELAGALAGLPGVRSVPGFGCSDCRCPSHLVLFAEDPRRNPAFQALLLHYRTDRLVGAPRVP